MSVDFLGSLFHAVAAVCPVNSVSAGDPCDRATWDFDPRLGPTAEEIAAQLAALPPLPVLPEVPDVAPLPETFGSPEAEMAAREAYAAALAARAAASNRRADAEVERGRIEAERAFIERLVPDQRATPAELAAAEQVLATFPEQPRPATGGQQMSAEARARLHAAIAAVCPIEGVRVGRVDDRASWGIQAAPEATPEEMQAALDVLANFDPDAPEADDVRAECQRRLLALCHARDAADLSVKIANAQREAARYLNIIVAGNPLADDQAARRTVLMELDAAIERLRAKSNALEATSPIPKDYADDKYWP